jgi:hypothetical protein
MLQTKALTASGAVKSGPGALAGVLLTAGADAASVTIYDNTAGSGTKLAVIKAAINTTASWTPTDPQVCSTGLYAEITGTTPDIFVLYI